MKLITAKFKSKCAETGKTINRGDACIYDPHRKKVYTLDSNKAKETEEQANDQNNDFDNRVLDNIWDSIK